MHPQAPNTDAPQAHPRHQLLTRIVADPEQPRKTFLEGPLQDLADEIWADGLLQPITVTPNPEGDGDQIFMGERRYRAFLLNQARAQRILAEASDVPPDHPAHRYETWTVIPVLDAPPMSPVDRILRQVAENGSRADLTLLERALAYHKAQRASGHKPAAFADLHGIPRSTMSTYTGLANAKGWTKLALEQGRLTTPAAANVFQRLPADTQEALLAQANEEESTLTRNQLEKILASIEAAAVKQTHAQTDRKKSRVPDPSPRSPDSPREDALAAAGPTLQLESLLWLNNAVEHLSPEGEDEPYRQQVLAVLSYAILHESPVILVRESGEFSSPTPLPDDPALIDQADA
jgi:ParB family chromosome partitioning protein